MLLRTETPFGVVFCGGGNAPARVCVLMFGGSFSHLLWHAPHRHIGIQASPRTMACSSGCRSTA